jgi:zinc transporter ZupT
MRFTEWTQHVQPTLGEGQPSPERIWIAVALVAVSTMGGAWLARRRSGHVVAWLAIASATMLVVTLTDLIPDAWRDAVATGVPIWIIGAAAAAGFLAITYLTHEDYGLEVASHEAIMARHAPGRHRRLKEMAGAALFGGMGTAAALATHRAIEGATLALSTSAVVVIALMVHSASEGLALAALLDMAEQRLVPWLLVACLSPALGVLFATFSPLPGRLVPILLGMVAGVLMRTAVVGLRLAVRKHEGERPVTHHLAVAAVVAVTVAALLAMAHEAQRRVGRDHHTRFLETFGHGARPPRRQEEDGPADGHGHHGTAALPSHGRVSRRPVRRHGSPAARGGGAAGQNAPAHVPSGLGSPGDLAPGAGPRAQGSPTWRPPDGVWTPPGNRPADPASAPPSTRHGPDHGPGPQDPAHGPAAPGAGQRQDHRARHQGRQAPRRPRVKRDVGASARTSSVARRPAPASPAARAPGPKAPAPKTPAPKRTAGRGGAEILAAVKTGRTTLVQVLQRNDPTARGLLVTRLLQAVPGCQLADVHALLSRDLGYAWRRVGDLSRRQRRSLLRAVARCPRPPGR